MDMIENAMIVEPHSFDGNDHIREDRHGNETLPHLRGEIFRYI